MREANTTPRKQRREARQRQQPVKYSRAIGIQIHICQKSKQQNRNHAKQRPARAVDVGENPGRVALLGQGGQRARTAVHAADANGHDRHENDDVHEGVEALQVGVLADQDKGRGVDIGIRIGAEEVLVGGRDEEADKKETQNVKEGDAPKHLLDGAGKCLYGVLGFCGREAHELGAGKGKRGRHKDGAKPAETILKGAWVVPEPCAPVVGVLTGAGPAAEDEDKGDDDEDDGRGEFEQRGPEFFFGVA